MGAIVKEDGAFDGWVHGRREFVRRLSGAAWGVWLTGSAAACRDAADYARGAAERGDAFQTLSSAEGDDLVALCSTLIPSGDLPGSTEAGAAYFIDRLLGTTESALLPLIRDGLGSLGERVVRDYPGSASFAALLEDDRIGCLQAVEAQDPAFFGTLRYLNLIGTFCHPDLGGNRDMAGWRLAGMEPANAYEPPFGYYDRPYHEQGSGS